MKFSIIVNSVKNNNNLKNNIFNDKYIFYSNLLKGKQNDIEKFKGHKKEQIKNYLEYINKPN